MEWLLALLWVIICGMCLLVAYAYRQAARPGKRGKRGKMGKLGKMGRLYSKG